MPGEQTQDSINLTNPAQKGKAKYSSKDGSRFLTGSKSSADQTATSTINPTNQTGSSDHFDMSAGKSTAGAKPSQAIVPGRINAVGDEFEGGPPGSSVNRKKQKRRLKQAARAAEQETTLYPTARNPITSNGHSHHSHGGHFQGGRISHSAKSGLDYPDQEFDDPDHEYYTDDDYRETFYDPHNPSNGHVPSSYLPPAGASKKKSKKKKKGRSESDDPYLGQGGGSSSGHLPHGMSQAPPPPPQPLSNTVMRSSNYLSKDRIWDNSTQEERERIKEFWLGLSEADRRSLVKVEKEAVLRKMKEQQKHSCSCTVCGRKRTAIEEELEVLYDAYYEELEQYANHQQGHPGSAGFMPGAPSKFDQLNRPDSQGHLLSPFINTPSQIAKLGDEVDAPDVEDFSDETDGDDYSDELEDEPQGPAADFLNFGNSLTVQGGILTVADDLLKNDGKKFIEMMEQLAERRMQREEEASSAAYSLGHSSHNHAGHNHPPPPEDDYDDEDEDEYESQEDEDFEDDEMVTMSEDRRMEEGRRMFQIFAARMFEQRVLTAYREKVAKERQQKLLEELEEESRLDVQREAKKAKEAQKKKDKKRQQKQAKEEEKARKEADKAAEEAALRAVEEKKAEEIRVKKEEQRKKREAEKKAQDEERQRKEAEKQKRLQDERERQAEIERRQREQKERERKKKEEAKKRERETREAKEKDAREKKEQEEKLKREQESKLKAEKESRDRTRKEEQAASQTGRRNQPNFTVPIPPGLQSHTSQGFQSPHLQIATPAIPKAPSAVRPRQASQQGSVQSSPRTPQVTQGPSQSASPATAAPQASNLGPIGPPGKAQPSQAMNAVPAAANANPSTTMAPPSGLQTSSSSFMATGPLGINGLPSSQSPAVSTMPQRTMGSEVPFQHQVAPIGQHRGYGSSNDMPFAAGPNGFSGMSQSRGFMNGPIGSHQQAQNSHFGHPNTQNMYTMPTHSRSQTHSRQPSASEKPSLESLGSVNTQTQPIGRPAVIGRPPTLSTQHRGDENQDPSTKEIDDLSNHLGSSALLDDSDEPIGMRPGDARRGSIAQNPLRAGFVGSPPFPNNMGKMDNYVLQQSAGSMWGSQAPFSGSNMPVANTWSTAPGAGWSPNPNTFGTIGAPRAHASRPVQVRLLTCQACKQLTASTRGVNTFHDVNAVLRQIDSIRNPAEPPITLHEMLPICETEGSDQNGGGFFSIMQEGPRTLVKYEAHDKSGMPGKIGMAPGDIGSPIPSAGMPTFGARQFPPNGGITSPSGF